MLWLWLNSWSILMKWLNKWESTHLLSWPKSWSPLLSGELVIPLSKSERQELLVWSNSSKDKSFLKKFSKKYFWIILILTKYSKKCIGNLKPVLKTCLNDDWAPDLRFSATVLLELVFTHLRETLTGIYLKNWKINNFLKRLWFIRFISSSFGKTWWFTRYDSYWNY